MAEGDITPGYLVVDKDEESEIRQELDSLRQKHRELAVAVDGLQQDGADPIELRRLKKQKLALKDRIALLEDQLLPDIIA